MKIGVAGSLVMLSMLVLAAEKGEAQGTTNTTMISGSGLIGTPVGGTMGSGAVRIERFEKRGSRMYAVVRMLGPAISSTMGSSGSMSGSTSGGAYLGSNLSTGSGVSGSAWLSGSTGLSGSSSLSGSVSPSGSGRMMSSVDDDIYTYPNGSTSVVGSSGVIGNPGTMTYTYGSSGSIGGSAGASGSLMTDDAITDMSYQSDDDLYETRTLGSQYPMRSSGAPGAAGGSMGSWSYVGSTMEVPVEIAGATCEAIHLNIGLDPATMPVASASATSASGEGLLVKVTPQSLGSADAVRSFCEVARMVNYRAATATIVDELNALTGEASR